MEYNNISVTTEDQIIILKISRPTQLNALNAETLSELDDYIETAALDQQIKGMIITGEGNKAFVAGADIKEFVGLSVEEARQLASKGQAVFQAIENLPFPVVAAINGYALGGGFELALACHIRIAGSSVKMGLPEVKLGLIPGYGGTQRLTKLIGRAKALELISTGEMIEARKAKEYGIVSYVTTIGNELLRAKELIGSMTQYSPNVLPKILQATKIALDGDGYDYEAQAFGDLFSTSDAKEGIDAFIEKRKPDFRGF